MVAGTGPLAGDGRPIDVWSALLMKDAMNAKPTGVWMGLRRCGCPVAVAKEYGPDAPKELNAHVARSKRQYLREGLSVVYATWDEWRLIHSRKFLGNCEHGQ